MAAQLHQQFCCEWKPARTLATGVVSGTAAALLHPLQMPAHVQADSGKAKIEDTATQLWSSSSKWLRSAGKKLASAAKESATQLQTKLETIDPRFAQKGKLEPPNVNAAHVGAAASKGELCRQPCHFCLNRTTPACAVLCADRFRVTDP